MIACSSGCKDPLCQLPTRQGIAPSHPPGTLFGLVAWAPRHVWWLHTHQGDYYASLLDTHRHDSGSCWCLHPSNQSRPFLTPWRWPPVRFSFTALTWPDFQYHVLLLLKACRHFFLYHFILCSDDQTIDFHQTLPPSQLLVLDTSYVLLDGLDTV